MYTLIDIARQTAQGMEWVLLLIFKKNYLLVIPLKQHVGCVTARKKDKNIKTGQTIKHSYLPPLHAALPSPRHLVNGDKFWWTNSW